MALGLKKETADCGIYYSELAGCDRMFAKIETEFEADEIPAWSLHRLIELKQPNTIDNAVVVLSREQTYDKLIGMIAKSIKEGYFNKEYLEE